MKSVCLSGCVALVIISNVMSAEESQPLFDFAGADAAKQWQNVNDNVMGGVSDGKFKITDKNTLLFFGTLSLENNGGFASVRTKPKQLGMQKGDALLVRVRGDGREYTLNLYVNNRQIAFSYRAAVPTKKGEWFEVKVPLDEFEATSFGRLVRNADPMDPKEVNALGFLLGDKTAGPFTLEVEWIKVVRARETK
jgi:NADH dehydrogenase [ubiquinone] 1 alpha subcomplex assembly factor 1